LWPRNTNTREELGNMDLRAKETSPTNFGSIKKKIYIYISNKLGTSGRPMS